MIGGFILSAGAVECAQDQRDARNQWRKPPHARLAAA